jgi:hypothetical protein
MSETYEAVLKKSELLEFRTTGTQQPPANTDKAFQPCPWYSPLYTYSASFINNNPGGWGRIGDSRNFEHFNLKMARTRQFDEKFNPQKS